MPQPLRSTNSHVKLNPYLVYLHHLSQLHNPKKGFTVLSATWAQTFTSLTPVSSKSVLPTDHHTDVSSAGSPLPIPLHRAGITRAQSAVDPYRCYWNSIVAIVSVHSEDLWKLTHFYVVWPGKNLVPEICQTQFLLGKMCDSYLSIQGPPQTLHSYLPLLPEKATCFPMEYCLFLWLSEVFYLLRCPIGLL